MKNIYVIKTVLLLFLAFCNQTMHCQTTEEIKNLEDFAKLYGYVKYFHPSDEASTINWQSFATHGVHNILNNSNSNTSQTTLQKLFVPIAPTISFNNELYTFSNNAKYPVYWVHNGLGIDNTFPNFYSYRYNKSKSIFHKKSASLFLPYTISKAKASFIKSRLVCFFLIPSQKQKH
ncbi:hypothetical protein H1R17_06110 [Flavobacterium sp. xlx-214]|uniref:hypothetical protein n=1 Tax=unclassified Flavobacterium TaxID=196869 RepID=UPI0013D11479|nr:MULTISPECIES: hypothetical protein [unclassified Flavobacterium]MBA5792975.1 hypothetical protein [Flavobacterium sp. xlx-221]QMI84694.1 hypothetical protein H1R17_06110 [Flavobacterium sp. xlx-214]